MKFPWSCSSLVLSQWSWRSRCAMLEISIVRTPRGACVSRIEYLISWHDQCPFVWPSIDKSANVFYCTSIWSESTITLSLVQNGCHIIGSQHLDPFVLWKTSYSWNCWRGRGTSTDSCCLNPKPGERYPVPSYRPSCKPRALLSFLGNQLSSNMDQIIVAVQTFEILFLLVGFSAPRKKNTSDGLLCRNDQHVLPFRKGNCQGYPMYSTTTAGTRQSNWGDCSGAVGILDLLRIADEVGGSTTVGIW